MRRKGTTTSESRASIHTYLPQWVGVLARRGSQPGGEAVGDWLSRRRARPHDSSRARRAGGRSKVAHVGNSQETSFLAGRQAAIAIARILIPR